MQNFKKILFSLVFFNLAFINTLTAKSVPNSFADLAEKLMPSVVNISTTQTIKTTANPFPFQFPPGSPFEEMFKDYNQPTERKASSL
jgi:serine protease Do